MPKYNKNEAIIEKIVVYCDEINNFVVRFGKSYESFFNDYAYQRACSMCILQIGELANRLTKEFIDNYDKLPWPKIRGMRNVLAHDYDNMLISRVWQTIENDIPGVKNYCLFILNELNTEKDNNEKV